MVLMTGAADADPSTFKRTDTTACVPVTDPPPPVPGGGATAPTLTVEDFRRLNFAASAIGAQPGRHSLKGSETNIYAQSNSQEFEVTLLGRPFRVKATPIEYHWNYGDGTTLVSGAPGGPIPEDRWGEKTVTSHVYQQTGDVAVGLTTVFTGEFSVDGGPFQPIPGTAQVPSAPLPLSIWRSEVKLYADDCNANPDGAGCR